MKNRTIRIGTRGSQLALYQADKVADALRDVNDDLDIEIVEIKTSGDWKPEHGETRLSEVQGGKGLFAKEIERAILDDRVDCGVHSMKDMPSFLPDGLVLDHVLERVDPRDAFLSKDNRPFEDLPQGAKIGSASTRRAAFLLNKRPDLKVEPLRGNVPTRIKKLRDGQVDATVLAVAGLNRLGLEHEIQAIIEPKDMLPAAGQGIIGIEIRADDSELHEILSSVHHIPTGLCVLAERAALQVLDGSCQTPIGAYATLNGNEMKLEVAVAALDGSQIEYANQKAIVTNTGAAEELGNAVGNVLKNIVPSEWLQKAS